VRRAGRTIGRARFVVVDRRHGMELRSAGGADACGREARLGASGGTQPPAGILGGAAQKRTVKPQRHRRSLGARFAKGGLRLAGTADEIPYWAYILIAFAVALLGTAAVLPRAKAGLSAALLLAFVGCAIILGLTIAYAFA
jgi:hypothetical protein